MRRLLLVFFVLIAGCGSDPQPRTGCIGAPKPLAPPQPSDLSISVDAEIHLTPVMRVQTGLPETVKVMVDAKAHSETISVDPLRSRHEGSLRLSVTDGSGEKSLADVNIKVDGKEDGSPNEGLGRVLERFLQGGAIFGTSVGNLPQKH
jgi:hypothetical protein